MQSANFLRGYARLPFSFNPRQGQFSSGEILQADLSFPYRQKMIITMHRYCTAIYSLSLRQGVTLSDL
jgi:hypothetical protein